MRRTRRRDRSTPRRYVIVKVLVLDSENKSALASIRSFAGHGVEVISGSTRRITRGSLSRYSTRHVLYPLPGSTRGFVDALRRTVAALGVDVVLPIGDATNRVLSQHAHELAPAAVPVADWRAMQIASDKDKTFAFAAAEGIPMPRTFDDKDAVDVFPVVVKGNIGAGNLRYVNDRAELQSIDTARAVIEELCPWRWLRVFRALRPRPASRDVRAPPSSRVSRDWRLEHGSRERLRPGASGHRPTRVA